MGSISEDDMGWMVKNFKCRDCGHEFEDLYKTGAEHEVECESCGVQNCFIDGISSPTLSTYEMADKEGKAAILRKRSADHTKAQLLKDADRFGGHGMQRRHDYKTGKIK
jgi:transcription elongation factor Elf1